MSDAQQIGVYDFESLTCLLTETVRRLDPDYQGPWDPQALVQYLEALVLAGDRAT
jgi:hypothetical protein